MPNTPSHKQVYASKVYSIITINPTQPILEHTAKAYHRKLICRKALIWMNIFIKLSTRLVKGLRNFRYKRQLKFLGIPPWAQLRLRTDIFLAWSILRGRENIVTAFASNFDISHPTWHAASLLFPFDLLKPLMLLGRDIHGSSGKCIET